MSLVLLLAAATAVGAAFDRFSVPGGLIVGAMLGAAAVTLLRGGSQVDISAGRRGGMALRQRTRRSGGVGAA